MSRIILATLLITLSLQSCTNDNTDNSINSNNEISVNQQPVGTSSAPQLDAQCIADLQANGGK